MTTPADPGHAAESGSVTPDPSRDQPPSGKPRRAFDIYTVEGFGAFVAQMRRTTGLSQTKFGAAVGASRPWMSDLERGKLRGGQLETALACIHELGYRVVLEDARTKPSSLDDLKNAMRDGPLARRPDSPVVTSDSPQ